MDIGRRKGSFRLRLIDLDTGKSKTITIYSKKENKKPALEELIKKIIECLRAG